MGCLCLQRFYMSSTVRGGSLRGISASVKCYAALVTVTCYEKLNVNCDVFAICLSFGFSQGFLVLGLLSIVVVFPWSHEAPAEGASQAGVGMISLMLVSLDSFSDHLKDLSDSLATCFLRWCHPRTAGWGLTAGSWAAPPPPPPPSPLEPSWTVRYYSPSLAKGFCGTLGQTKPFCCREWNSPPAHAPFPYVREHRLVASFWAQLAHTLVFPSQFLSHHELLCWNVMTTPEMFSMEWCTCLLYFCPLNIIFKIKS